MTTATPTSLTLQEKKRLWNESKFDTFQQISKDKALIFNYFLVNNDILKMISPQDEFLFKATELAFYNQRANVFLASLAGVLIFDQLILRFLFPKFKIPRFRFIVNFSKYVLLPITFTEIYKEYFMGEYQYFFYKMQENYSFGFQDYMKASKIFERALQVDRLEQLLEKRGQFDWKGIPQLPQQNTKKQ